MLFRSIQGSPIQAADPATVYNNRPFYVDYQKGFQYNECGMKSACGDYAMPQKQTGDLWVLLMGGSAMEGMGSNKDGKWFDITHIPDHPYTETIAACLQRLLSARYPTRNVRVFNAAVSGFTLSQGFLKYKSLSSRYDFDWVISMDGVNECDTLASDSEEAQQAYNRAYWAGFPFQSAPLKYIVPITQHSALFNTLKQEWYYLRLKGRMTRNERAGFPDRRFWAAQTGGTALPLALGDPRVANSRRAFLREMHTWEDRLRQDHKKYLFLVQPYLPFRDTALLTLEERALRQYLLKTDYDPYKVTFFREVYDSVAVLERTDPHIQTMSGVDHWPGWTFVDYCHFTRDANERIASELARWIQSDGNIPIFTP